MRNPWKSTLLHIHVSTVRENKIREQRVSQRTITLTEKTSPTRFVDYIAGDNRRCINLQFKRLVSRAENNPTARLLLLLDRTNIRVVAISKKAATTGDQYDCDSYPCVHHLCSLQQLIVKIFFGCHMAA